MSAIVEKCDWCGAEGRLGGDISAFKFATPKGTEVIRYLHATDDERRCYHYYEDKYRKWLDQQRARGAANG